MNLKDIKLVVISLYVVMVAAIFLPLFSPSASQGGYGFISMSVLGGNSSTTDYYVNDTGTLKEGVSNRWTIRVTNDLKDVAYVAVKVKVIGLGSNPPDVSQSTPSDAPAVYQFSRVLLSHEEAETPFVWSITAVDEQGYLESLKVNGETIRVNTSLGEDMEGKLVFELWKYNPATGAMTFQISQGMTSICVWNQINFKIMS